MFKIDLNKVHLPGYLGGDSKAKREKDIERILGKVVKEGDREVVIDRARAEELVPEKRENIADIIGPAIDASLSAYLNLEYLDKERNVAIVPFDIRKKVAKIRGKVEDSIDGKIELSDEQMDFLIEVGKSDGIPHDHMIFLVDYLEETKIKQKK